MELFEVSDNLQDPILKAYQWIKEAQDQSVALPHAMNIASLNSDGKPSSRMVLLKRISNEGFVFFTDYEGNKGQEITDFPHAALTFWWAKTNKQIRIEGACSRVSEQENDDYFASRPRGSQISASISKQSEILASREQLYNEWNDFKEKHEGQDIKRPDHWGGICLKPDRVEFWQSVDNYSDRLHERIVFRVDGSNWVKERLYP